MNRAKGEPPWRQIGSTNLYIRPWRRSGPREAPVVEIQMKLGESGEPITLDSTFREAVDEAFFAAHSWRLFVSSGGS